MTSPISWSIHHYDRGDMVLQLLFHRASGEVGTSTVRVIDSYDARVIGGELPSETDVKELLDDVYRWEAYEATWYLEAA